MNIDKKKLSFSFPNLYTVKNFFICLYAASLPFFVFSVFLGRDTVAQWVMIIMLLIWMVEIISNRGRIWIDSTFICLIFFLAAYLLNTLRIFLIEPANTWLGRSPLDRAITIDIRLFFAIISYIVCVNYLANVPREVFLRILRVQFFVGIIIVIIAVFQYAAYIFEGRSDFLRFEPTNVSYYVRGSFFRLGREKFFRTSSIYNEPAVFAFFLIPFMIKGVIVWIRRIGFISRFWTRFIIVLILLGIISNLSFTAVLSSTILLIIFGAVQWFGPYRKNILLAFLFLLTLVGIISLLPFSNIIYERVLNVFTLKDGSTLDRLFRLYTSYVVFLQNPLIGVGPGGYAFYYPRMGGIDTTLMATPLNIWLHFLTDNGILGTLPFIFFIVMILKNAFITIKKEILAEVYLWSVISYLILLTFSTDFCFIEMVWFELAVITCIMRTPKIKGNNE